jgi:hypothetical protein
MKRLLIGGAFCALFAAPGLAGEPAQVTTEPVKLTLTQMDVLTAGCDFAVCTQINETVQNAIATAAAVARGGGDFSFTKAEAEAEAENENETDQRQGTD